MRALINPGPRSRRPAAWRTCATIATLASDRVTVSAPATEVWLPAAVAAELGAAVTAVMDNVSQHCPSEAKTWILLEEESTG